MPEHQVSRRGFLKKAVPVIAGVGLAGAMGLDRTFGALTATSPTNGTGPSTTPGTPLATASYVIAQEKDFEAQNGTTGKIDFSGTNATQVIQSAINALPEGGLIFIRRGVYPMTGAIVLSKGIHLLGEQGAVIRVQDGAQNALNPFNIIEVLGDNVTIENLELDGNVGSNPNIVGNTLDAPPANPNMQSGIVARSGQNGEVSNCLIHDLWNAGIWLAALDGDVSGWEISGCQIERTGKSQTDISSTNAPQSGTAIYAFRLNGSTSKSIIHDNVIKDVYGQGIYLHFDIDSIVSDNILATTPATSLGSAGIIVDDYGKRIKVRGNQISGFGPGIFIVWAGCEDIIVEGNGCFDAPNSGGSGYGVLVDSAAPLGPPLQKLIIKGNICRGNALSGISVSSSETLIEGNICYNNNQETQTDPALRAGIIVQGAGFPEASNISIIGNRCFDDQATPTQYYGISVAQMSSQISNVLITNNDLRKNGIGAIGQLDCGPHRVTGNLGYNPKGMAPIAVGGSPFVYTNQDGVPEAVYVNGGLVSQISKGNTVIFSSSPATVLLEPGETITITHSDPPQMLKDMH